ncbi:ABC transporter substrate-binding protein [Stakelama marina]|uniref:ABC transporter substrate-binding protein n=1 Tax=Stakelama marina TaxID=2826939 RepID=A0A8T4I9I0_9SPHN|nr:penicillin-binding protein activator [Stakelama marina]MBR0551031.1 ABC transporter substrate-binding protein [Stakelama marina]
MDRRQLLRYLRSGLVLSSTAWAASPLLAAKSDDRPVALLVPLTGPRASLGLSMQRAALLAENDGKLVTFDTGGTPEGAAAAAKQALDRKCALILGPLLSGDVASVTQAAGGTPVIAFTNSADARSTGAFIFGITASQVTSAILSYARSRGVRSVAVISDGSAWGKASGAAATGLQGTLGMEARTLEVRPDGPLPIAGDAPDAVLVPGGSDTALSVARNLKGTGIQMLGTLEALDHRPTALEVLDGAWIASPDPVAFGKFASDYQARNGGNPGAIAALAYDAAGIAKALRASNALSRAGVLSEGGFPGVAGQVRFRTDGSVARDFAILLAGPAGYKKVASSQGA